MSPSEPQKPVHEVRIGGTITASVWENTVQRGDQRIVTHNLQLKKRYFDKADQTWKTSGSLYANDLPRAVLALQKAYEWIMMQPRNAAVGDDAETEDMPI
ncbi:MAG: hypothetical protein GY778_19835 [bacterium]|nr:hypothetical protein [bacterium]